MARAADPTESVLFAALALERGLVTPRALTLAAEGCLETGKPLPDQLVEDGALAEEAAHALLAEVQRGRAASEDDVPFEHPGRYEMAERTGRGGQAVVMVAFDRYIGRDVALKILSPEEESPEEPSVTTGKRSTPNGVRFLREARVTGQLEHPNIVPVHEVGRRADGTLYYAMRLVRGRTLAQALSGCSSLQERLKLLNPFHDVCNAIAFAHSRGVVHRDIKPANVMVGEFGETVVLDWGIAKVRGTKDIGARDLRRQLRLLQRAEDEQTQAGLIGTPSYMSPEQASGDVEAIDDRSDVWALGVVLYEILTGRRPFKGEREIDTLVKIANEEPPPILELCPDAPRELAAVAEKALRKKKEDRYQSALELAEEVGSFMTGGRVRAYEYSSLELLRRFAAKNRAALVAASALLVAIVVALVAVTAALRQESRLLAREAEARAREEQALASEHVERLLASFHLAQAYIEKAERMSQDGRHEADRLLAAASLAANPAHPKSPYFEPSFAADHPEAEELRVQAASRLYRTAFGVHARLEKRLDADDALSAISFTPDSNQFTTASSDGAVALWNPDGTSKVVHRSAGRAYSVAVSADGRRIASGGQDHAIRIDARDGSSGGEVAKADDVVSAVAFAPGSDLLAAASWDGNLRLVDGTSVRRFDAKCGKLQGLAISPNGQAVALACEDGRVPLVDVKSLKATRTLAAHSDEVLAVAFSPDGRLLATAGLDRLVRLWDASTGEAVATLEGHTDGVMSLAFSRDGKVLASGGYDRTARLWDVASHAALDTVAHGDFVTAISFAPDSNQFATASYDKSIRLWRLEPGRSLRTLAGHSGAVYALKFSPDGKTVASAGWDKTIRLWDAASGDVRHVLSGHDGVVDGVAFTPDGRRLVSSSRDRTVRVWDVETGAALAALSADEVMFELAVSPDGKVVSVGGADGKVREWDLATFAPRPVREGHVGMVNQLAWSPDGSLLATAAFDRTVRLWSASGAAPRVLEGHTDWASGVDFSPDGKLLASSGKDAAVLLWNVADGRKIASFPGHRAWVNEVHFSRDGVLLASASDDGTVRVWDVANRALELIVHGSREIAAIDFAPDGSTLAVGDGNDVRLFPLDFSALDADAKRELENAQKNAGSVLDGFDLRPAVK